MHCYRPNIISLALYNNANCVCQIRFDNFFLFSNNAAFGEESDIQLRLCQVSEIFCFLYTYARCHQTFLDD